VSTLTCHLVTRNPAAAAAWYGSVLGAVETGRITLPGGQVMTIELRFGDSTMAIADEFPRWAVDQHIRDVPPEEVARLAAEAFGQGTG
jgi:PhnB protein